MKFIILALVIAYAAFVSSTDVFFIHGVADETTLSVTYDGNTIASLSGVGQQEKVELSPGTYNDIEFALPNSDAFTNQTTFLYDATIADDVYVFMIPQQATDGNGFGEGFVLIDNQEVAVPPDEEQGVAFVHAYAPATGVLIQVTNSDGEVVFNSTIEFEEAKYTALEEGDHQVTISADQLTNPITTSFTIEHDQILAFAVLPPSTGTLPTISNFEIREEDEHSAAATLATSFSLF